MFTLIFHIRYVQNVALNKNNNKSKSKKLIVLSTRLPRCGQLMSFHILCIHLEAISVHWTKHFNVKHLIGQSLILNHNTTGFMSIQLEQSVLGSWPTLAVKDGPFLSYLWQCVICTPSWKIMSQDFFPWCQTVYSRVHYSRKNFSTESMSYIVFCLLLQ